MDISPIVAGMWRLCDWQYSTDELLRFIESCIDLGVTTFDHADIYGDYSCEELFGKALAKSPALRDKMQLLSKCDITLVSDKRPEHSIHGYDTSKEHILKSVETSLTKLCTDHLDLLLLHRPDPLMDADEAAEALTTLKDSGKVLAVGVSNFTVSQFELLASRLSVSLVTNQIEFSVLNMDALDDGTLDQCQQRRIRPMAWSPFGGGRLFQEKSEQAERVRNTLQTIGADLNASLDQIALAWILKHPARILPVLGTGKIDRVRQAVKALNLELSRDQWFAVWEASKGHEVP